MSRRRVHFDTSLVLAFAFCFGALFAQPSAAHAGNHNDAAWRACDAQALNDACEYVLHENIRARGSCRDVSDALLCVRNKPYEPIAATTERTLAAPVGGAAAALVGPGLFALYWFRRRSRQR